MDILLELSHILGAEGVGHCLSLSCVLGSISGVEEAALDADEGVVVVAAPF